MGIRFTIKQNPLQIEFDADSIAAGVKEILDNESHISRAFGMFRAENEEEAERGSGGGEEAAPKGRRGRKKNAAAGEETTGEAAPALPPVTASAPPPAPIPGAPAPVPPTAPAPAAAKNDDLAIPPFLDRTKQALAAPPPPPATAAAPPPPPAPPAAERLADKVVGDIRKRKETSADAGVGFMSWLTTNFADLITKDATIDEAIAVIQFQDDAKIARLAQSLGVS